MTSGTGILYHSFDHFAPVKAGKIKSRQRGVLISNAVGSATAFSLWNLQERGKMLIGPQTEVYEGMLVGIHSRDNDLVVNVVKGKQLTNVRASGSDESIILVPPVKMSLEQALDFIADDELVEITPGAIRLRKRILNESDRKSHSRQKRAVRDPTFFRATNNKKYIFYNHVRSRGHKGLPAKVHSSFPHTCEQRDIPLVRAQPHLESSFQLDAQ